LGRVVAAVSDRPTAADLLERPGSLLSTSHLRELRLSRRAIEAVLRNCPAVILPGYRRPIEAVLRNCPAVILPGYRRPLIRVEDYLTLVERSLDRGDRVWPG
jgi:hypothetical protein